MTVGGLAAKKCVPCRGGLRGRRSRLCSLPRHRRPPRERLYRGGQDRSFALRAGVEDWPRWYAQYIIERVNEA